MIRHRSFRPTSSTVTSFVALFGNASDIFGPPVSASPNCWIDRAMTVHRTSLHVSTAPGVGRSYTVQYFIGAVQTGVSASVSGTSTDQSTNTEAAIPASGGATETFAHAWKVVPAGTPAVAQSLNVTHLYEDDDDPAVNIFAWGNGSVNMVYPGSPTFIGMDSESFAAENVRQTVVAADGTFFRMKVRYITSAGTNYDIEVRKNGVTIDTTAIAGSATAVIVSDDINVPVVAGDLISFRINRTLGAGTTFIAYVQIYWRRT